MVWVAWIEAEPAGLWLVNVLTMPLAADDPLRTHLLSSAAHMRPLLMGLILLLVLRFSPRGIIPEAVRGTRR